MKRNIFKTGIAIIGGFIITVIIIAIFLLLFNLIGHMIGIIFKLENISFLQYSSIGVKTIMSVLVMILFCYIGCMLFIKLVTRYDTKKRNMFECPYDIQGRSCKHMNTATGYLDIDCKDCDWYDKGIRVSKFKK